MSLATRHLESSIIYLVSNDINILLQDPMENSCLVMLRLESMSYILPLISFENNAYVKEKKFLMSGLERIRICSIPREYS